MSNDYTFTTPDELEEAQAMADAFSHQVVITDYITGDTHPYVHVTQDGPEPKSSVVTRDEPEAKPRATKKVAATRRTGVNKKTAAKRDRKSKVKTVAEKKEESVVSPPSLPSKIAGGLFSLARRVASATFNVVKTVALTVVVNTYAALTVAAYGIRRAFPTAYRAVRFINLSIYNWFKALPWSRIGVILLKLGYWSAVATVAAIWLYGLIELWAFLALFGWPLFVTAWVFVVGFMLYSALFTFVQAAFFHIIA